MGLAPARTPKASGFGKSINLQARRPGLSPARLLQGLGETGVAEGRIQVKVAAKGCSSHLVMTKALGLSFLTRKKSVLKHEAQIIPTILSISSPGASPVAQTVKCLPAMWETWVQSLGWEDPLEKEMATHSSTLAWKIPWTEKPGGLQSVGSQSRTRMNAFTFNKFPSQLVYSHNQRTIQLFQVDILFSTS